VHGESAHRSDRVVIRRLLDLCFKAGGMIRRRLLDLCCKAGGAARGYADAGFEVVGVDIEPQPHYPYEFHQADALTFPLDGFDAVHASPPCQLFSAMSVCRPGLADEYPDLIGPVRDRLQANGVPWVIENVEGAPLSRATSLFGAHGLMLCGHMFGLPLYRHRLFETSFPISTPYHPAHRIPTSDAGHWRPGTIISVAGNCAPIALAREAMGIDWMTRDELAESIPPAYTKHIGRQLLAHLGERGAAA
jgi:DNA (cytosine-5)-methyltransferase 1